MLEKGLKRFAVISAIVGFVFIGGMTFFGTLSAVAEDAESPAAAEEAASPAAEEAESQPAEDGTSAVILKVSGMTCAGCSGKVKTALENCEGVIQAEVSHQSGKAVVKVNEGADTEKLIEAVKKAGFKAES